MANSGLDCCTLFAKILLILLNIFYLLVSLCVAGVGVYILINNDDIQEVSGSDLTTEAIVIVVVGVFTLLTALLGLIGAAVNFWPLLVVYCFLIVIIIGIQIAVGVLAFVSKDKIKTQVTPQLVLLISNYTENTDSQYYNENRNKALDFIQTSFKCCGLLNATDWIGLNPTYIANKRGAPDSCVCDSHTPSIDCKWYNISYSGISLLSVHVWNSGCVYAVEDYLKHNLVSLGAGAVSFALLQILTVFVSISLCICTIIKGNRNRSITRVQNIAYTPLDSYPANNNNSNMISDQHNYNQYHDDNHNTSDQIKML